MIQKAVKCDFTASWMISHLVSMIFRARLEIKVQQPTVLGSDSREKSSRIKSKKKKCQPPPRDPSLVLCAVTQRSPDIPFLRGAGQAANQLLLRVGAKIASQVGSFYCNFQ